MVTTRPLDSAVVGHRAARALLLLCVLLIAMLALSCALVTPEPIIRHPDAPMLVTGVDGAAFRVAVYDRRTNSLVDYGTVRITAEAFVGWTVTKYDWEAFLLRRADVRSEASNPSDGETE